MFSESFTIKAGVGNGAVIAVAFGSNLVGDDIDYRQEYLNARCSFAGKNNAAFFGSTGIEHCFAGISTVEITALFGRNPYIRIAVGHQGIFVEVPTVDVANAFFFAFFHLTGIKMAEFH